VVALQDRLHARGDRQASPAAAEVLLSMRRFLLPLALTAILAATAAPAPAQSGGAEAPAPDAAGRETESGGAHYYPNANGASKPSETGRAKRAPAKKRRASRPRPSGGAPIQTPSPPPLPSAAKGHRFPLVGPFTFGGKDSRFGAGRRGRTHQGQDVGAVEGTPVVAPRTGTVEVMRYQASGAGHYIVLDGDGEDRDYVFMHLRAGSVVVTEGQRVGIGTPLGQVGNTGVSFGAHLHFEVWVGGWYTGGEPIDPLPLLQAWARALPARLSRR
jgi:murein DD-endopeptidase MepM/ murein hydrolase activator NlpD